LYVLSNKKNAIKMMGNWLAGPSKMDFVEAIGIYCEEILKK
jgi:hypothetical protein